MLKFLGPFEKYIRSDEGDPLSPSSERMYFSNSPKTCKNVQGEGRLSKVYVNLCSFNGVFSHLNCLFLFLTSLMGK